MPDAGSPAPAGLFAECVRCKCTRETAWYVNIPAPERYDVHKLIVRGERPAAERVKAEKYLEQASALAHWYLVNGQALRFNAAWRDAAVRGSGRRKRADAGRRALLARHADLSDKALWRS